MRAPPEEVNTLGTKESLGRINGFKGHRQHPIKILDYTSKALWLLLIPIAKNLVTSHFDIHGWLRTYWLDIFIIAGIIAFAVFRWMFVFYNIGDGFISANTGPFGIIRTTVRFSQISAIRVEQGLIKRAFHASTINLETQAKSMMRSDIKLVISDKHVNEIFGIVASRTENKPQFIVQPKNSLVLIYSVMFSSVLSGLIIFGTFMWQAARMFGTNMREVADQVNNDLKIVDQNTLKLSETVPSFILLFALAVIFGWGISFVNNLLDNWDFKAARRGREQIMITSGKYKHNKQILNRDKICYYDIRQSLLMKLARISSVHAQGSGFGRKKNSTAALIPMTKNSEMMSSFKLLEPELGKQRTQIRPSKRSIFSFLLIPFILLAVPIAGGFIAKAFTDGMDDRINSMMVIISVPLVWYMIVQGFASRGTSVGMTADTCTVCSCPRYQFHKVIIPIENIAMVTVKQNPVQRLFGTCTLLVYSNHETRRPHKAARLPYKQVLELLGQYIDEKFLDT